NASSYPGDSAEGTSASGRTLVGGDGWLVATVGGADRNVVARASAVRPKSPADGCRRTGSLSRARITKSLTSGGTSLASGGGASLMCASATPTAEASSN